MLSTVNYWLHIQQNVYCVVKNEQVLLYNTKNGHVMETSSPLLVQLIKRLHEHHNLGAIMLEEKELLEKPYDSFVSEFVDKAMGNLSDTNKVIKKPVMS